MQKNYNYILTIVLYPFILIVGYLILNGYLKSNFYLYLALIMIIIFIPSFIMSLYNSIGEIINSQKKWRSFFLIIFSFFYLPIYYTKYVAKNEKYLGFIISIIGLIFSYLFFSALNNRIYLFLTNVYRENVVINDNYIYTANNRLFSINVSKDFRCNSDNIGDYVIYCDRLDDDSFIGVYSYETTDYDEEELLDIANFHINQSLDYIRENSYEGKVDNTDDIVRINYNNMVILLTQKSYLVDDKTYTLIIIKEMLKQLEDILDFKKMIETIVFFNYNEEVSS